MDVISCFNPCSIVPLNGPHLLDGNQFEFGKKNVLPPHPRSLYRRWNISHMLTRSVADDDYYSVRFAACFALKEFHPRLLEANQKSAATSGIEHSEIKKVCSLSPYPHFWSWIKDGRLKKKMPGLHNQCWHFNGDILERICDAENTPVLSECQHIVTGKP